MIPNGRALLRPGMIVSLDAQTAPKAQPVAVAPLNAIIRESDASAKFAVMVLEGGVVRLRPVSLGETYGNLIAVNGVAAGEKVVSSGASFVHDGDSVEVIP
jgi:multidrug efflux pump subunit AcrA (membrane-fusion protein)